jgi:hypothetical protein
MQCPTRILKGQLTLVILISPPILSRRPYLCGVHGQVGHLEQHRAHQVHSVEHVHIDVHVKRHLPQTLGGLVLLRGALVEALIHQTCEWKRARKRRRWRRYGMGTGWVDVV